MQPNSQYGNAASYYGNILLGNFSYPPQHYGGWLPRKHTVNIEDGETESAPIDDTGISQSYANEVAHRAAIIRELTAQIKATRQAAVVEELREQRKIERQAMERAAKLRNIIDDEEALFILFQ